MKTTYLLLVLITLSIFSCRKPVSSGMQEILSRHPENRTALLRAYRHFENDSLKLKALLLLLRNMGENHSIDYHFQQKESSLLNREEVFSFFDSASTKDQVRSRMTAFKQRYPGFISVKDSLRKDIRHISSEQLINNIDIAFLAWKMPWARSLSFEAFCEFVLPYRSGTEPLSDWRKAIFQKAIAQVGSARSRFDVVTKMNGYLKKHYGYNTLRPEVFPCQFTPEQMEVFKGGACEDLTMIGNYYLRSIGIPTVVEFTPCWGMKIGSGHTWLSYLGENGRFVPFNACYDNPRPDGNIKVGNRMAKVFRMVQGAKGDNIQKISGSREILPSLFRNSDFIDVTKERIKTVDIKVRLDSGFSEHHLAYLAVPSAMGWKIVHWGMVGKDGTVTFKNMGLGILYLPVYYDGTEIIPAGQPFLAKDNGKKAYFSNNGNLKTKVILRPKMHYSFRYLIPGSLFDIFEWKSGKWTVINRFRAEKDSSLNCGDLPKNRLYFFRQTAGTSRLTIRPFTVADSVRVL